jgi:hypothetical protein
MGFGKVQEGTRQASSDRLTIVVNVAKQDSSLRYCLEF